MKDCAGALLKNQLQLLRGFVNLQGHTLTLAPGSASIFTPGIDSPQVNTVYSMAPTDSAIVAGVIDPFAQAEIAMMWQTDDPNLGPVLLSYGMMPMPSVTVMHLYAPDLAPTPEIEVEAVRDLGVLRAWADVAQTVFNMPGSVMNAYFGAYSAIGTGEDAPVQHLIVRKRGVVVATGSYVLAEGVVGLYNIGTVLAYRGRGIASALTGHMVKIAAAAGVDDVVLATSNDAHHLYLRLGFTDCGRLLNYLLVP